MIVSSVHCLRGHTTHLCHSIDFNTGNPMKLFQEGDKSKALCGQCNQLCTTTFVRRDVPFSDGKGNAKGLLVGVCDGCNHVVAIPAQSTPAIREARQKVLKPLEAVLPAIYVDVLDCAAHAIDPKASTDFRRVLLSYFLHRAAQDDNPAVRLLRSHEKARGAYPELRGASRRRLSMKITQRITDELQGLMKGTQLNTTEVIKSVVFDIQAQVLESPKPVLLRQLKALAAVAV